MPSLKVCLIVVMMSLCAARVEGQPARLSKSYILDSLNQSLRLSKPDSNRVMILVYLCDPGGVMYGYAKSDTNLDTAIYYLKRAEALSDSINYGNGRWHVAMRWAYVFLKQHDIKTQEKYLLKALSIARNLKSANLESVTLQQLSSYYRNQNNMRESIRCLEEMLYLARHHPSIGDEANALEGLATRYLDLGNNELALCYASEAMEASAKEGQTEFDDKFYLFSKIYRRLGDYPQALSYILKAIENVKEERYYRPLCTYYWQLGLIYDQLDQTHEAISACKKAVRLAIESDNKPILFSALHSAVEVLVRTKQSSQVPALIDETVKSSTPATYTQNYHLDLSRIEYEISQNEYSSAERSLSRIIRDNDPTLSDQDKIELYRKTSEVYFAMKNFEKSRVYLDKSKSLNSGLESLKMVASQHLAYFKLDSAQGNFLHAIKNYQRYKALNDSIFNTGKSRQIANLQVQFETREKEKNIALLRNENEVQQAALQQKEFERNAFIVGAILLLMVVFFVYSRFRMKLRTNLLLELKQIEVNAKNQELNMALMEKEALISDKEILISSKDALLIEKEWLLKEIHHRVKNNLQVITGLLTSQAFYLEDGKALSAIQESQHRVHAMSLIHQKLYHSDKMDSVDMNEYIHEVVEYLTDAYRNNNIDFALDIGNIKLDPALAVPLGLIINEAITNCLKYAFNLSQNGKISISLLQLDDQSYSLIVSDNGRGLPENFNMLNSRSLGMSLMNGLSNQLGGTLMIKSQPGLTLKVLFNTLMTKSYAN